MTRSVGCSATLWLHDKVQDEGGSQQKDSTGNAHHAFKESADDSVVLPVVVMLLESSFAYSEVCGRWWLEWSSTKSIRAPKPFCLVRAAFAFWWTTPSRLWSRFGACLDGVAAPPSPGVTALARRRRELILLPDGAPCCREKQRTGCTGNGNAHY